MSELIERERILIVDDEPANLKVMREVLGNDYRLSFAKSGELALQLIKNEPPRLILLDVMMPDMNGFEVCEILKSTPETAHIPIIFVTAYWLEFEMASSRASAMCCSSLEFMISANATSFDVNSCAV